MKIYYIPHSSAPPLLNINENLGIKKKVKPMEHQKKDIFFENSLTYFLSFAS